MTSSNQNKTIAVAVGFVIISACIYLIYRHNLQVEIMCACNRVLYECQGMTSCDGEKIAAHRKIAVDIYISILPNANKEEACRISYIIAMLSSLEERVRGNYPEHFEWIPNEALPRIYDKDTLTETHDKKKALMLWWSIERRNW